MTHKILFILMISISLFSQDNEVPVQEVNSEKTTSNKPSKAKSRNSDKFFTKEAKSESPSTDHFLALHIGSLVQSTSYKWGEEDVLQDAGKLSLGVTYRIDEWSSSMDLLFRADYQTYQLDKKTSASKLSILPCVIFPEASSQFPLYFGAGLGPGVFFKQLVGESNLTLDYQLLAGVRLFNVLDSTGFFVETGLKNHLHLLSDGQFNSTFFSGGAVFTF